MKKIPVGISVIILLQAVYMLYIFFYVTIGYFSLNFF